MCGRSRSALGLIIDYSADGTAIGLEITDPGHITLFTLDAINDVLRGIVATLLDPEEMRPLLAA